MPTPEDHQFKELVLANKLATPDQVEECVEAVETYKAAGIEKPLSSVFLDKGYLTHKQVSGIHRLQGKSEQYVVPGYTILETLGQGGLGIVYKARQDSIGRPVALKIMFPNFVSNKEYVQRFMREARVSAQLDHPNIVKGIDFGECGGIYFFAMEFVEGRSLKEIIKEKGRFNEIEAANIILQVADGLKYAENHNLLHRDIKPENIMLTHDGIPKLCDLGLAKTSDSDMSLTRTGVVMGTPHYISPEQAIGQKDLDMRSDIYSLGVSFYHIVTGEVPYKGTTVVSIISQHLSAEVPSPRDKNPEISENLCRIIQKMMEKKREDRYQTTQELIVDLKRFLRNEPSLYALGRETSDSPKKHLLASDSMDDTAKQMIDFVTAATINIGEEIGGTDIKKLAQSQKKDTRSQQKEQGPGMEERPDAPESKAKTDKTTPRPPRAEEADGKSKDLVEHLEGQVQKMKPRPSFFMRLLKTAFLLSVLGGAGYLIYEHRDRIKPLFFPVSFAPADPQAYLKYAYHEGDDAKKAEMQFEAARQKIKKMEMERTALTEDMALVQGGSFVMGSPNGERDEKIRKMEVKSFFLDKQEVSNQQYSKFCEQTGYPTPEGFSEAFAKSGFERQPVVRVSWYDATLYAQWRGKRLPTEAEWEYAVKSNKGGCFPWGNDYQSGHANVETGRISLVDSFPKGTTKNGLLNMVGNVWEWTSTDYDENAHEERAYLKNYVTKGGSFSSSSFCARASYRNPIAPYSRREDLGFRCALDKEE